ncbi:hypothetical protein ACFL5F_06020 [Planctomycetota bacterium]
MRQNILHLHDKPPATSEDVNLPMYGQVCHDRIFKEFSNFGDGFDGRGEK